MKMKILTRSGERRFIRWNKQVLRSVFRRGDRHGEHRREHHRAQTASKLSCFSHKKETVGKLAGGVAHEFNSIMTAIIGQSELMLEIFPREIP